MGEADRNHDRTAIAAAEALRQVPEEGQQPVRSIPIRRSSNPPMRR
jgi:hypothetical protein